MPFPWWQPCNVVLHEPACQKAAHRERTAEHTTNDQYRDLLHCKPKSAAESETLGRVTHHVITHACKQVPLTFPVLRATP